MYDAVYEYLYTCNQGRDNHKEANNDTALMLFDVHLSEETKQQNLITPRRL